MKTMKSENKKRRAQRIKANAFGWTVIGGIFSAGLIAGVCVSAGAYHHTAPAVTATPSAQTSVKVLDENMEILEDPMEAEKIEAALVAQGYFRDDVPMEYELQDVLHTACEANGIPYHVGLGLIEVESSFDAEAVSSAGCYGLVQLHPEYFPADLSPADNITTGIEFLAYQLERYDGDMAAALTAYNAGHDTGSRGYATAVLEAAEKWMS